MSKCSAGEQKECTVVEFHALKCSTKEGLLNAQNITKFSIASLILPHVQEYFGNQQHFILNKQMKAYFEIITYLERNLYWQARINW